MLYLLDANIPITANSNYYPIDQVPEFWEWLQYQGERGNVKIPLEIMEEIRQGRDEDPLVEWIERPETQAALLFQETVDAALVQRTVAAYAPDLTDSELLQVGNDPFLIAYALAKPTNRCVVTIEVSRPSTRRQNRKVPDVCRDLGVQSCGPFQLNKDLGFSTKWRPDN
jgi:Domain of unknown function (DUF4411)